jgi:hypothetical protein
VGSRRQVSRWGRAARIRKRREGAARGTAANARSGGARPGAGRRGSGGAWAWRGGGGGRRRAAGLEPASTVLGREIEEEGRLGGEERDELPSCRTRRLYAPLHSSGVYSVLLVLPPF